MPPPGISLRPVAEPGDLPFLGLLYAASRDWEMVNIPWGDDEKRTFLAQQFECQTRGYAHAYPDACRRIITAEGEDAGRLYTTHGGDEIRIIDIAIMPAFRNRGIGGALLRDIQEQGRAESKFVSIHVEKTNPARRLYGRLGFNKEGDREVYDFMVWRG